MEDLLSELDYFEPNVTQLSVMGDYDRVFGTGQTLVQSGPIEFVVREADSCQRKWNWEGCKSPTQIQNTQIERSLKI